MKFLKLSFAISAYFFMGTGALAKPNEQIKCSATTINYKTRETSEVNMDKISDTYFTYASDLFTFEVSKDTYSEARDWRFKIRLKSNGHLLAVSSGYFGDYIYAPLSLGGRNDEVGFARIDCFQQSQK